MKRCRLTAPAQMDGALREPGYEFTLEGDALGPHTTRRVSHDTIDVLQDSNRILGKLVNEPLYEVVEETEETEGHAEALPTDRPRRD